MANGTEHIYNTRHNSRHAQSAKSLRNSGIRTNIIGHSHVDKQVFMTVVRQVQNSANQNALRGRSINGSIKGSILSAFTSMARSDDFRLSVTTKGFFSVYKNENNVNT